MSQVTVVDYYSTKFGELWDKSLSDLIKDAVTGVVDIAKQTKQKIKTKIKSKIPLSKVDAIFVGNMLSGVLENNLQLAAKVAQVLGVNIPIFRIEGACSSGGLAFHLAKNYLESGAGKTVLVLGVEKMTDYPSDTITQGLMGAASGEEQEVGLTFPAVYAIIANRYMHEFGYSEEHLAQISVKNHYHGTLNEKAQFRREITVDQVLKSQYVASPLKVLDCSPISDGAASLVLSVDSEIIKKSKNKMRVLASEVATDSISLADRESLVSLKATELAAKKAFKKAELKPKDIQVAELHDCFSIAEIIAMEDIGFWKKGEGGKKAMQQENSLKNNGKLITNTSGGLKSNGHPVGATGVKQIGEIFLQLTGQAEKRQVPNCVYGLAQNVGGSGGTAVISIFEKF